MKLIDSHDRNGSLQIMVDDDDYERLRHYKYTRATKGAVFTSFPGQSTIQLTQLVLGVRTGFVADHIDRDKLNFQKENLRLVTNAQNSANQGLRLSNSSGFKGVSWHNAAGSWQARLTVNGVLHRSYGYATERDAAIAYDNYVRQYSTHGVTNESLGLLQEVLQ